MLPWFYVTPTCVTAVKPRLEVQGIVFTRWDGVPIVFTYPRKIVKIGENDPLTPPLRGGSAPS